MANSGSSPESRILCVFEPGETLTVEQVVERLPEIRWNQVFRAITLLNERGELVVRTRGFRYEMTRAEDAGSVHCVAKRQADAVGAGVAQTGEKSPARSS